MPRPSSPVCAKASTNCPYLTLESPHHQHQRRTILADHQLGRATQRGCRDIVRVMPRRYPSVRVLFNLSQIIKTRISTPLVEPALRLSLRSKPIPRGIDFKNPFTMSKRSVSLQHPTLARRDLLSSSNWIVVRATRAVSRSQAAPYRALTALAVLAAMQLRGGGAYRDRTDDLMLAKQPLSQLS